MLEEKIAEVPQEGGDVRLQFRPFEVKTIRLALRKERYE
jgi:alpha-mannosidase